MRYAFIREHTKEFKVLSMCRVLKVHRSGFYKWLLIPKSKRQQDDEKLIVESQHFFQESHESYGSPRIHHDLLEIGIRCGRKRVERLMRQTKLRAVRSYKSKHKRYLKPSLTSRNLLKKNSPPSQPMKNG